MLTSSSWGMALIPSISRNYSVSQRTEKIMLITLAVFLPSPPQDSVTTSVNIATGFLTGQYHDSFPDLTIFIGSCVPCADIKMVRGSLSVALKVPLILIQLTVPSMSGQVLAFSPRHEHTSTYSCAAHQFWRQWRRAGYVRVIAGTRNRLLFPGLILQTDPIRN